jgi:WD40 repeat protein
MSMLTPCSQRALFPALVLALTITASANAAAPPTRPVRRDGDGNPMPPGAIARLGTLRGRFTGKVSDFVRSPDGKRLAVCLDDGPHRLVILDLATKQVVRTIAREERSSWAVAFSPDGKTLAEIEAVDELVRPTSIRLWDVGTGKELRRITLGDNVPRAIAFSPEGKALAAVGNWGGLFLWDVRTGKLLRKLPKISASRLLFSPDGKALFERGWGSWIRMWDAATGKLVREYTEQAGRGEKALALSPDGRLLAGVQLEREDLFEKEVVCIWDVRTGNRLHKLSGHTGTVQAIAFSPDGKALASQDHDWTIRLWDVGSGKEVRRLEAPEPYADCLTFSSEGRLLISGGGDRTIHVWEVSSGKKVWPPAGHTSSVDCIDVSPDGKTVASGSSDGTLRLWDMRTGKQLRRLGERGGRVLSVAFSPDGKVLACGGSLWRVDTGAFLRELESGGWVAFVGFADGGKSVVWSSATVGVGTCKLTLGAKPHRLQKGKWEFMGHNELLHRAALSANGKVLAVQNSSDHPLRLWALPSGKKLGARMPDVSGPIALSPDGALLAFLEEEDTVAIREVSTGAIVRRCKGAAGQMFFSPDGRALATAEWEGGIRLVEVATGQERRRLAAGGCGRWANSPAARFSPDGRLLVTGSHDTTMLVWDLTGQEGQAPRTRLSARELESLAGDLAGADAVRGYRAIWALAAAREQAPAFLLARLRPAFRGNTGPVAGWMADLNSDEFARRDRAREELERLGELAEPALRKALADKPSLEPRRRIEQLLRALHYPAPTPGRRLAVRAVEVLEQVGTVEARRALQVIAREAPGAWLRREAKGSLERLATRP